MNKFAVQARGLKRKGKKMGVKVEIRIWAPGNPPLELCKTYIPQIGFI